MPFHGHLHSMEANSGRTTSLDDTLCRQQPAYSADVRIASDAASHVPSEGLSFGTYASANHFQTHANLSANANGSLALSAADISMLPSRGTASVGLGKLANLSDSAVSSMCQFLYKRYWQSCTECWSQQHVAKPWNSKYETW